MDHSLLILYTQSIYTTLIIGHKKDRASDFIAHRRLGTRTVHRTIACSHASLTAIHQCRRNGTRRLTHTLLGGGEPRLQMHRRFAAPAQAVESRVLGARRILGSAQHGQALGLLVRTISTSFVPTSLSSALWMHAIVYRFSASVVARTPSDVAVCIAHQASMSVQKRPR